MVLSWPLVGREREAGVVRNALADGRSVVVGGAAGVGKSRLAKSILDEVSRHRAVRRATGTASAAVIPFGALGHLITLPSGVAASDRFALLQSIVRQLVEDFDSGLLLSVDDAHLLDDASAAVIQRLVSTGSAHVLLTVRSGLPVPDAIASVWKEGLADRIELLSLDRTESDQLVEAVLEGRVEPHTLDQLWDRSLGNVLFLRALVDGALEARRFGLVAGWWRWEVDHVPGGALVDAVEARLADLAPRDRHALEVVAVTEPGGLALVEELAPEADLGALERAGLLIVETSERRLSLRLAHPLYAEVLRTRCGRINTRAIQRSMADAVGHCGTRRREDLLRVATWRLESGAALADSVTQAAAAVAANRLFNFALGERLARSAIENRPEFAGRFALAQALTGQDRSAEAEKILAELADEATTDDEHLQIAIQRVTALFWQGGQEGPALEALAAAEEAVSAPNTKMLLRGERANVALNAGHLADALELALPLLEADDEPARLRALQPAGVALALSGHGAKALALAADAVTPALRCRNELPRAQGWVFVVRTYALTSLGRLDEISLPEDTGTDGNHYAAVADDMGRLALLRGRLALTRGQPATAVQWLRRSAAILAATTSSSRPWCLGLLAEAEALVGDHASANLALIEANVTHESGPRLWQGDIARAGAWVAAARGELSRAAAIALDAADACHASGAHMFGAVALHDAARFGAPDRVADRLAGLAGLDGAWFPAFADHVSALLTGNGLALDRSSDDFERIGALLLAAEAATEAAAAYRAQGLSTRAIASAVRARSLGARCEGARTPVLDSATHPPGLTRREREIVLLASRGLTNRDIAKRLVVSIRTVEGHLLRAYAKLGTTNRSDLGRALGDERMEV